MFGNLEAILNFHKRTFHQKLNKVAEVGAEMLMMKFDKVAADIASVFRQSVKVMAVEHVKHAKGTYFRLVVTTF